MPEDERPTISTAEAMSTLGVSRATVTRLLQRGELDGYKLTTAINSPLRIYKDTVDALLKTRQLR